MWTELDEGAALFSAFWNAPIDGICIENPVMHKHAKERIQNYEEFAQSVQPWQSVIQRSAKLALASEPPPLEPTSIVDGRQARVQHAAGG